jgi:hypothetical protein
MMPAQAPLPTQRQARNPQTNVILGINCSAHEVRTSIVIKGEAVPLGALFSNTGNARAFRLRNRKRFAFWLSIWT